MRSAATLVLALVSCLAACDVARDLEPARAESCSDCHGYPPAQLSVSGLPHPADANCYSCHRTSVTPTNEIAVGGTHFDGKVDLSAHALPYVGQHAAAARAAIASCTPCHGADYGGGAARSCTACHQDPGGLDFADDWRTNCTFCHGVRTPGNGAPGPLAAPPATVAGTGDQSTANPKVGAHQAHLVTGTYSGPLPCESCHAVPARTFPQSLAHLDGRIDVEFSTTARQGVASPAYAGGSCAVYCHGSTYLLGGGSNKTPAWTASGGLLCDACHTLAPTSGEHATVHGNVPCSSCHPGTVNPNGTINVATGLHVNGTFEASPITTTATFSSWPTERCVACHPAGIPGFP